MSFRNNPAFRRLACALLALVWFVALAPAASAQTSGAALNGTIKDKDGAPLPGVTVTATNTETGFSRVTVTGADG